LDVLKQAKATLPFAEKRDFEEQKKGFVAPMKELKIMCAVIFQCGPNFIFS